jgi:hypothetical protein
MVDIKTAQFADQQKTLVFVLYADETSKYVTQEDGSDEAYQLSTWLRAGNTIGAFVPVISGGVIPAGTLMWFCAQRPPTGYLLCDGSAIRRAQYAVLFRTIGTIYGAGDGSTTFNLPNLVGRFVRGWGPVSPLDPTRGFGSYQENGVGEHGHGLPPDQHTHTIVDPGHIHGVTDPGHIHDIVDPGHNHTVTDPGHQMLITTPITHQGWISGFSNQNVGCIRISVSQPSGWFRISNYVLSTDKADMVVSTSPSNLRLSNAQSNVTTNNAVTNVTIDAAETNIPSTGFAGVGETRPENITLLPVIRY